MKVNKIRNSFFLVLAAFIWGVAFVAQTTGTEATGPYTFNCVRSFIGDIFLIPVIKIPVSPSLYRCTVQRRRLYPANRWTE